MMSRQGYFSFDLFHFLLSRYNPSDVLVFYFDSPFEAHVIAGMLALSESVFVVLY